MPFVRTTQRFAQSFILASMFSLVGCVATGPLVPPPADNAQVDPADYEESLEGQSVSPIRLVSFPTFHIKPLWPTTGEGGASTLTAPFRTGASAVKAGAGQIKSGFVQFGNGTKRAFNSATKWFSSPLVEVEAEPAEPPLMGGLFGGSTSDAKPRTANEFLSGQRVR